MNEIEEYLERVRFWKEDGYVMGMSFQSALDAFVQVCTLTLNQKDQIAAMQIKIEELERLLGAKG